MVSRGAGICAPKVWLQNGHAELYLCSGAAVRGEGDGCNTTTGFVSDFRMGRYVYDHKKGLFPNTNYLGNSWKGT